jgi:hypothetical protein
MTSQPATTDPAAQGKESPEIGRTIDVNGIATNYHDLAGMT